MIEKTFKVKLKSKTDSNEYDKVQKNLLNSLNFIVYGLVNNRTITLEKNPETYGVIVNMK